jgi:hypothetical protein
VGLETLLEEEEKKKRCASSLVPPAHQRARRRAALQVCHCPEPRDRGLECAGAAAAGAAGAPDAAGGRVARHFTCDECFSAHVERPEALADGADGAVCVACCAAGGAGCGGSFSLQEAAQHASALAFLVLQRNADDRRMVALQARALCSVRALGRALLRVCCCGCGQSLSLSLR